MKFNANAYTITVRKEKIDGEILYVGQVAEFPNISSYEKTPEIARALIIDAINTLKKIADETHADETHAEFPQPRLTTI